MIPPYDPKDIRHIIKYYAQKESEPKFYTFDQIDKSKLDVSAIARHIVDEDMGIRGKQEYLNSLWDNRDENLLRLFFGKKVIFLRMVDIEIMKLVDPKAYEATGENVKNDEYPLTKFTLDKIKEINPEYEHKLREGAFAKAKVESGYKCAHCGKIFNNRQYLHVDHIIPMNKGGLSVTDNLQILCRSCNAKKGDKLKGEE